MLMSTQCKTQRATIQHRNYKIIAFFWEVKHIPKSFYIFNSKQWESLFRSFLHSLNKNDTKTIMIPAMVFIVEGSMILL